MSKGYHYIYDSVDHIDELLLEAVGKKERYRRRRAEKFIKTGDVKYKLMGKKEKILSLTIDRLRSAKRSRLKKAKNEKKSTKK